MPLNIDIQQILLHILNFVILFGGMYFILYSPVKKFIDARQKKYEEDEETAKKNLSDSEKAKAEYMSRLENAENELRDMRSAANEEAAKDAEEIRKKAEAEAAAIIEKARAAAKKEADAERREIIEAAKRDAAGIAADAAEKIVFKNTSDAYDGFLKTVKDTTNDKQE